MDDGTKNTEGPWEVLVDVVRALQEAFKPDGVLRRYVDALPEIQKKIDRFPGELRQALEACGFPAINNFFTFDDADDFVEIFKREGTEAARLHIEGIVRDALSSPEDRDRLLKTWQSKSFIAPRIAILQDALEAHVNKKYTLSVPVFISQLEGVVAAAVGHKGQMWRNSYMEHIRDLVKQDTWLGQHVEKFIDSILLAEFKHGTTLPFDLSRHAIVHAGMSPTQRNETPFVPLCCSTTSRML
jgi:hypothetical protein